MNEQFIFWDLETTGKSKSAFSGYNQITQVGAILTDHNFEIKDKLEINIKLREGKWFEPGALLTTGIDPTSLIINNYPNFYEGISQLYETFQQWSIGSTTFIGFNNISFDEAHLRQAFYQNLMPEVYMTVTNNNSRMDVYDILRYVNVYDPEIIKINTHEDGKQSLKLEDVSKANNISTNYEAGPHDAVYDSLITLELNKVLSIRSPKIWNAAYEFRHRDTPKKFMVDNLVFTNTNFFKKTNKIDAQTSIAQIPGEKHKFLVFNLLYDPKKLHNLKDEDLAKKVDKSNKDRICEVFDCSKSKVLLNESYCFKDNRYIEIGVDELRNRANFIKKNEEFCSRLIKLYLSKNKFDYDDPFTIEERIFDGFPSHQDKKLMIDFHTSPNNKKYEIAKQFKDERYKEIAVRIIYEIAQDTLPEQEKRNYEFEIRDRFNDNDKAKWNSKNTILANLEKDIHKMIQDENDRVLFKQKVITFLNNESAKWD